MITPVLVSFFRQHLNSDIRRYVVGFSGGLDSTVLLHALNRLPADLRRPLHLVHVHHGLHPSADDWAENARQAAVAAGAEFSLCRVCPDKRSSLEDAARRARYAAIATLMEPGDALLLAHHRDDQAETVLFRLFRGAGVSGLSGMKAVTTVPFSSRQFPCWRPLLALPRKQLEQVAVDHRLRWVDDTSNDDVRFSRNFLRRDILPRLQSHWPVVSEQLADTALRMQDTAALLEEVAMSDYQQATLPGDLLAIDCLMSLSRPRRLNVLRYWLRQAALPVPDSQLLARIIDEVCTARTDATPLLKWRDAEIRRYRNALYAMTALPLRVTGWRITWLAAESTCRLPDSRVLSLKESDSGGIDKALWQQAEIQVCFRVGGEVIQPAGSLHHRAVKTLLQGAGIPPWQRERIPMIYLNGQLAAVGHLWVDHACWTSGPGLRITESPISHPPGEPVDQ